MCFRLLYFAFLWYPRIKSVFFVHEMARIDTNVFSPRISMICTYLFRSIVFASLILFNLLNFNLLQYIKRFILVGIIAYSDLFFNIKTYKSDMSNKFNWV